MTALVAALVLLMPQESAQRLRAGQEKIKTGDYEGAIPDFERCLQLQPEEYNAWFGLGTCFWEKEEFAKSRDHFLKVVQLVERDNPGAALPGVHQKLLACALLLEDFDAAIAEADKLIRIQSTGEYYYARALARRRKGDLKGALDDGAAALKEDPLLTKARTLRAEMLLVRGDPKSALDELAEAIRLRPSDPTAFLARATLLYFEGRWVEARLDLQTVGTLNRGQNNTLENQACACALDWLLVRRLNVPAPAVDPVAAFEKTLKDLKRSPARNHLLGLPLHLADRLSEADLLKAAEAAPGRRSQARAEALFFIGEKKLLLKDVEGARAAFLKCDGDDARGLLEFYLARNRLKELAR
ncbi:MAG: tetratricopeptide repeat protein [Planctomycetes bacterium]|nr:tetratricopeptide repeat protein [Planctomycetota bacterium]